MTVRTLLQYRIEEKLGEGGMGVVYRAEDTRLKRQVALKFLPRDISSRTDDRIELDNEAQLAASLNHPNVATIYSLEESDGEVFIAMEYIPGQTLEALLSDKDSAPIPLAQRLDIAFQIASGLNAAHQKGIVHGDITCRNIMMTPDGFAKILDFGVARKLSGASAGGAVPGTLSYMAPEQARGEGYDQRSDLWALGVVLYRLFSGVHPFLHAYEQATLYSIIHESPPGIQKYDPAIPEELEQIIARCMEKNPQARCQSAGEVVKTLDEIRQKHSAIASGSGPLPVPRFGTPKLLVFAAALSVALAGIIGGFLLLGRGDKTGGTGSHAIAIMPLQNIGPDRSDDYLGDGITEALITDLSKYPELNVTARRSVMQYRDEPRDLHAIAQVIGVRYILDGSIQKSGARIRISVQLVDASTGEGLWSERYDRELKDLFTLQDDISGNVVSTLTQGVLSGSARQVSSLTTNIAAYDFYLKGMSYAAQLDRSFQGSVGPSDEIAIGMFEQAVALDPRFAAARAALANSYLTKMFSRDPSPLWEDKAARQIDTALSLDPGNAEAHLATANLLWNRKKGFPHAETIAELRKALALRPSYADAHALLGTVYLHVGLHEESEAEIRTALKLDPNNVFVRNRIPGIYLYQQRYTEVVEEFDRNPKLGGALQWMKILALDHLGKRAQAVSLLDTMLRRYPQNEDFAVVHAVLLAEAGDRGGAEKEIARAIELGGNTSHFHHVQFNIACAYALLGERAASLEYLKNAARDGLPSYPLFAGEEFLRALHEEPEYQSLLERLKAERDAMRNSG